MTYDDSYLWYTFIYCCTLLSFWVIPSYVLFVGWGLVVEVRVGAGEGFLHRAQILECSPQMDGEAQWKSLKEKRNIIHLIGKPQENHKKTIGRWWFNVISWDEWLVVEPAPLKNMRAAAGSTIPKIWTKKHVPNHQPVIHLQQTMDVPKKPSILGYHWKRWIFPWEKNSIWRHHPFLDPTLLWFGCVWEMGIQPPFSATFIGDNWRILKMSSCHSGACFRHLNTWEPGWWFQPLWKIWVCHLGWWHSQYMEK